MKKKSIWVLLIKTDSYAGNFERDIAAHLTGCQGEHYNGGEYEALPEKEQDWFSDQTLIVDERYGDFVALHDADSKAVEIHFESKPPQYIIAFLKTRLERFPEDYAKSRGVHYARLLVNHKEPRIKILSSTIYKAETIYTVEEKLV